MKKIGYIILMLILFYQKSSNGQAREWVDSINSSIQEIPSVMQHLDDGSLLLGAIQRDFLFRGKGKLIVAWMDIDGYLIRSNKIELPQISISNCGGIYRNDVNEFIAFCTFDSSSNFRFNPTLWGYIIFDSLLNLVEYNFTQPQYRTTGPNGISDIRVKYWKENIYYGSIEISDNIIGSPGIADIVINTATKSLVTRWDTLRRVHYGDRTYDYTAFGDFRNDFEIIYDRYYLKFEMPLYHNGLPGIYVFDLYDSIYTLIYAGDLPVPDSLMSSVPLHGFRFEYRNNIKYYKDSLLLVAGSGSYWHNGYMIDTIYLYNNPRQSAIAFVKVNDAKLNDVWYDRSTGDGISHQFTFVHNLQSYFSEPYDEFNARLFADWHTSAFNQCLDFKHYNQIYFACQHSDIANMRIITVRPSIISISQFDSTLSRKWEKRINSTTREGVVSINATNDGGCVLVTRKQNGRMTDPTFTDSVPSFDIAVYKINEYGVMTGLNKINLKKSESVQFTLYPNPAKDYVKINGSLPIHAVQVWDSQGKQYHTIFNTTTQEINTSHLPVGIYYIQLFNSQNEILQVLKLVKE